MSARLRLRRPSRRVELRNPILTLFDCNQFGRAVTCRYCGATFLHPERPNQSKTCTHACFLAIRIQRELQQRWLIQRREVIVAKRENLLAIACVDCGQVGGLAAKQQGPVRKRCQLCKDHHEKELRNALKKSYDAKKRGSSDVDGDKITLARLLLRDGAVCRLCGLMTDHESEPQSATYPSVDHIVPLSQGGAHRWQNVRIVHRLCNTMRGNRLDAPIQTALAIVVETSTVNSNVLLTPVAYEVAANGRPVKSGQQKYRGRLKAESGR